MTKIKLGLTLVMFALPLFGQIALEGPPKIEAPKIEVGANPLPLTNPSTISMEASAWNIEACCSNGMPEHPLPASTGWSFNFPLDPAQYQPCYDYTHRGQCPWVGYVVTDTSIRLTQSETINIVFQVVSSGAEFDSATQSFNTCDEPKADFSIMIEHQHDRALSQDGYRWWAFANRYTFFNGSQDTGQITISVPLTPENWITVNGEPATQTTPDATSGIIPYNYFVNTLANIGDVGITFGGGCFAGHGAYLDQGTATFTLISYTVTK